MKRGLFYVIDIHDKSGKAHQTSISLRGAEAVATRRNHSYCTTYYGKIQFPRFFAMTPKQYKLYCSRYTTST